MSGERKITRGRDEGRKGKVRAEEKGEGSKSESGREWRREST